MTDRPTGPACGNNPNYRMSDGDRRAVEGFKAYLADRAALRDRIAEALEQADYRPDMRRGDLADAIMPVLPAAADRAATLRNAADHLARQADELWAPGTTAHTVMHSDATELRRLADEAQQDQAQARSSLVRWYVERHQHDGWWPASSPTRPRQRAVQHLNERRAEHPDQEFRLARATTTYAVEVEHQPAARARQDGAAS